MHDNTLWQVFTITRKILVIPNKVDSVRDEIVFHHRLGQVRATTAREALFDAILHYNYRHLAVVNGRHGLCSFKHKWDDSQPLTSEQLCYERA